MQKFAGLVINKQWHCHIHFIIQNEVKDLNMISCSQIN
jgi:hypothetical protein